MAQCLHCHSPLSYSRRVFGSCDDIGCEQHVDFPTVKPCDHCKRKRKRLLHCDDCNKYSCVSCHWGSRTRCKHDRSAIVKADISVHLHGVLADIVTGYNSASTGCVFSLVEGDIHQCENDGCNRQARNYRTRCMKCASADMCYIEHMAAYRSMRLFDRLMLIPYTVGDRHTSLRMFVNQKNQNRLGLHRWLQLNIRVGVEIKTKQN